MKREILKRALSGGNFNDLHIIDSHCHMGPFYGYYFPQAEIEEMIQDADIVGIERMCIAPHASISCDYKLGNRQLADAASRYPDRVWGLLVLNPHKPEEISQKFKNFYSNPQFIGVKIHPSSHGYNILGENYFIVFDKVKKHGGFILTHSWEDELSGIDQCERVIKAYPETPLILGHSGGTSDGVIKSIKLVNKYENAYMDTSGFEFSNIWIEEIMGKVDKSKVIFGSDCPYHDIRGGVSRILFADLDDDIKKSILCNNFKQLLLKAAKKHNAES